MGKRYEQFVAWMKSRFFKYKPGFHPGYEMPQKKVGDDVPGLIDDMR